MLQISSQARFSIAEACYLKAGLPRHLKAPRNDGENGFPRHAGSFHEGENGFLKSRIQLDCGNKSNNDSVSRLTSCSLKKEINDPLHYLYWLEDTQYQQAVSQASIDTGLGVLIRASFLEFEKRKAISVYAVLLSEIEEAACYWLSVLTLFNEPEGRVLSGFSENTYQKRLKKQGIPRWQAVMRKRFVVFEQKLQQSGFSLVDLPSDLQVRKKQYLSFHLLQTLPKAQQPIYRLVFYYLVQQLAKGKREGLLKCLLIQVKQLIWQEAESWVWQQVNKKGTQPSHAYQLKSLLGVKPYCYQREYVCRIFSPYY